MAGAEESEDDLEEVVKNLRIENERLQVRINKYEFNLRHLSDRFSGCGRPGGRSDMELLARQEAGGQASMTMLNVFLNTEVYPRIKFLPDNWDTWDERKGTLCQKVMNRLSNVIPEIWERDVFWHVKCVEYVRKTYRDRRANSTGAMKAIYLGENGCLVNAMLI